MQSFESQALQLEPLNTTRNAPFSGFTALLATCNHGEDTFGNERKRNSLTVTPPTWSIFTYHIPWRPSRRSL